MSGKILALGFICTGMAMGQTVSKPAAAAAPAASAVTAAPAKAYAFEVVSIRQNKTPATVAVLKQDGPTADGYRSHQPLALLLLTAYVPQVGGAAFYTIDQIKGLPDWMMSNGYDIDARIADEDRTEWQKPEMQKVMLRAMLQAMLAERCKLAVHREIKDASVYSLVVGKSGIKFKETDPTVEHPDGQKMPFGGVLVGHGEDGMSFYDTSMASFASLLSSWANGGRPVQDKTGLTGKYDFTLKFGKQDESADDADLGISPLGEMILSGLNNLGLKLDSEKGQVETLVIDHIERPSEN
ncbi:MAG: TIGR03435 family protein [Acidobacteriaceae bacterium]